MNKNVLITLLVIIIALLALLAFRPKNTAIITPPTNENTSQPVDEQQATPPVISTALPSSYVSSQTFWPPVIQTSTTAYSCRVGSTGGDVPTMVTQKNIDGKTYCITTYSEGAAGSRYNTYTYTTANGSGTKTTNFTLRSASCGGYGGPGDTRYNECQRTQTTFFGNLDAITDILMSK